MKEDFDYLDYQKMKERIKKLEKSLLCEGDGNITHRSKGVSGKTTKKPVKIISVDVYDEDYLKENF